MQVFIDYNSKGEKRLLHDRRCLYLQKYVNPLFGLPYTLNDHKWSYKKLKKRVPQYLLKINVPK